MSNTVQKIKDKKFELGMKSIRGDDINTVAAIAVLVDTLNNVIDTLSELSKDSSMG